MYLQLQAISKRFGAVTAVEDVSLEIEEGEFICFLGPSGCGKTTLLRMIAGLETQGQGNIQFMEHDLSDTPARQRNFGMVFQSYSLFPNLSVGSNVAYGLECHKWDREATRKRTMEMLDLVGLRNHEDKLPVQLSGGEQQRVALARALAPNPRMLLLDEPLSALDAKVRTNLRGEIRELQKNLGITTIMVTHDQDEAMEMADRIVVMSKGKIEQVGDPQTVYHRPDTRFVAEFVGRMNVLHVQSQGNRITLEGTPLEVTAQNTHPVELIGIRPEALKIVAGGENTAGGKSTAGLKSNGSAGSNQVTAKLVKTVFLGNFTRMEMLLGEQPLLLEIMGRASLLVKPGDPVTLYLPPDEISLLAGN